jgi:hypothetical protein
LGPRDLENGTIEVARRDTKEKQVMKMEEVAVNVLVLLDRDAKRYLSEGTEASVRA